MGTIEFNKLIEEYIKLSKNLDEINARKSELKNQIMEAMGGETEYENGSFKVTISDKENFKYNDEVAMISFLEKNGYENFVIKTINTALNKKLKENPESLEGLKPYYTKTVSKTLTVKEI